MPDPLTAGAIAAAAVGIAKSDASTEAVKATRAAIAEVWDTLFKPAVGRIGQELPERIDAWRLKNAGAVAAKVHARIPEGNVSLHPRLGIVLFNQSALAEDEVLQDMWSGLIAASALPEGGDDANLMFTDYLSRLTASQARILKLVCEQAVKRVTEHGLIGVDSLMYVPAEGLRAITGVGETLRIDRELDHLREIGLLHEQSGFHFGPHVTLGGEGAPVARLAPTSLALQLYAACNGSRDPVAFYRLSSKPGAKCGASGSPCRRPRANPQRP